LDDLADLAVTGPRSAKPLLDALVGDGHKGLQDVRNVITTELTAKTENVRARVDPETKSEAAAVLASMGLDISSTIRLLLTRIAQDHKFPFDPLVPNETTIAAMRDAREGRTSRVNSVDDLMAELDADD
jgi:DNA-damage-inducible protein J